MPIIDFLKTSIDKEELKIALKVLKEFKSNESVEEYMFVSFSNWTKFEQLEEFLEFLVNEKPLKKDTLAEIENRKKVIEI